MNGTPAPPSSADASEEPELVELDNGVRHPPAVRAAAFLGVVQVGERLDRLLDRDLRVAHGLSLRAYEILLHLAAFSRDGRLGMSALAEQAPLSQSRVSRLVSELDARGLVQRTASHGDSRAVEVSITNTGLDALRAAQDTHHRGLRDLFFAHLTWEEVVMLAKVTGKVLRANS